MRRPTALVRVLAVALLLPIAAFVVFGDALRLGEQALIQRQYREAIGHLRQALEEETAGSRDGVLLLLGRAHWLAGEHAQAVAAYQRLIDEHQHSSLFYKARFQQAEALAASGDYRAAAQTYRDEIARLTGAERKEEIAATYLGLAEKALGKEQPDHARAVAFFDLALDLGLSAEKARSVRLRAAEARRQQGDAADAIARFTPLVTELTREQGKLAAMLGLGRARLAAGDRGGARKVLRDLIATAKDASEAADAAYEVARTYGVPEPVAHELDRAIAALAFLGGEYPGHPRAKIAHFLAAQCYRHVGRSADSLGALRTFLDQRADAALPELAMARAMVGDVLYAQGELDAAMTAWKEYLQAHPAHAEWERVQRAIVDAEFERAFNAYDAGKQSYDEARRRFAAFEAAHPLDARNPEILLLYGEMLFEEERYGDARAEYARCVSKYPGKEASSRAQFRIGEIFESKTFNYHDALNAYRQVTWGQWAAHAQQRIAQLERRSLALATPRTYRSGEKALFKLTSRNIDKLRVRVFRLELETYFRATHTAGEVEKLDIEVIEPDRVFDSAVDGYQKYRETERDVDVGATEPGAYVVKVDDRELEATTLVIVTDIGMIAKTSRHECFVFTQNLKEERVESGVKVVLSDGTKAIAEGQTDASGVWRYKGEELKNLEQLRVFAFNAAGSGASTLDLSGLGYSPGLTAKGYLFSERPVYQPGQVAHIKGIVREVEAGLYKLPAVDGYRLQIASPSGRLLLQRTVRFSEFGTFAVDCTLPEAAELGEWSVRVQKEPFGDEAFNGQFTVARYERPRLQLEAKTAAPVVYRGEKIEGTLLLRYFFGEPAVDKRVLCEMQLPDGTLLQHEGRSNAAGEVPFTFDTSEFAEEAMAVITATVVEDNVRTQLAVPVVTTEFTPELSTVRSVYLAGEPFDVNVTIRDRSGKLLSRQGTVRLLRREVQGKERTRRTAEVEVESLAFETAAKTGVATVRFQAAKGGDYVVRVEAKDRFATTVTASLPLQVSGDDDEVKLRLLTDSETYKVGDTVRFKVANRAGPRLALRTSQGDGILAHESALLPQGESTIELRLQPWHAPNFALALAMIDGTELRTAERTLLVQRDLRIEVEPARDTAQPGDKVSITVRARDPQGGPVQAEVALALVDDALLSLYPDTVPAIGAFFYGTLRETGFRTVSSCTWSYRGVARAVSSALVAEERREEATLGEPAPESAPGDDGFFHFLGGDQRNQRDRAAGSQDGVPQGELGAVSVVLNRLTTQSAGRLDAGGQQLDELSMKQAQLGLDFRRGLGLGGGGGRQSDLEGTFAFADLLATDQPRSDFSETGAWVSSLVTDEKGNASVEIALPDSTTSWRLQARGVTRDTWVGAGEATLRTKKDLQVELVVPPALTEGDQVEISARVHNLTGESRGADVALKVDGTATPERLARHVELPAHREVEIPYSLTAAATGLAFELGAAAGPLRDRLEQRVPVRPFGVEVREGRSGRTEQEAHLRLSLPSGRQYATLSMSVDVGPDPGRDLVGAALGLGYQPYNCRRVEQTNLALAARGRAALTVLTWLEGAGRSLAADAEQLRGVAAACLSRLVAAQDKDGGFAWIGTQNPDVRTTSEAVRFLGLAKLRGMVEAEPVLHRAAEWLLAHAGNVRGSERARAALALASVGRASFELLNALHRGRASMGLDELALLALAWQRSDRAGLAGEVLTVLRSKLTFGEQADAETLEATALATTALLRSAPTDPQARQAIEWLSARRVGSGWATPSATAAALEALVAAGGEDVARGSAAEIEILVNDRQLATVPSTWKAASAHFDVPADWLRERDNNVVLRLQGRGVAHYAVVLTGFAKDIEEGDARNRLVHQLQRTYHPALLRHAGKALSPGFGVVQGRYKSFNNEMTKVEAGQSGRVVVRFSLREAVNKTMSPLVVEEPIPAGCSVPRASISGSYDHLEVEPDRLTFYYREGRTADTVSYELQARFPGRYRALPTRAYGALRPDLLAHGTVTTLTVLPRGSTEKDVYRMTPDEAYQLGKALFEDGRLEQAGEHLDALLREWHREDHYLRDDVFKDVARMMLFVSVARNDGKATVRFFEDLKDRSPELVIPFDKILAVGKAYLDLGEFERGLMVFRGTADASFLKEAAVATTLEQMGEIKASIAFLRRLLLAYPDLNTIRISLYSIGQKLAALAEQIADGAPVDDKVGKRDELRQLAVSVFRQFLLLYPDDPLAEEVSFAWATTHIEGGDLQAALAVAQAALARYPNSSFEDELLYTSGYVSFALGKPQEAFALLERVATGTFARPDGSRGPSENRDHAVYLQGQVHHSLGEPAAALADYDKVKARFSDAEEAADYFLRKQLSLPEVTTFDLDKQVDLEITFRNVPRVEIKVYRVDLMRLYLLEKSLNDIRGIQLHGIRPYAEQSVELGDGRDYRSLQRNVRLELAEPGAYLVVARGDDLLATGMVLRSSLKIEAQEFLDVGRLRVNVKSGDGVSANAHVKVIGSGDQAFRSGDTDLRGIFVADGLLGRATVIVKRDDQYAFFRGSGIHQPQHFQPPPPLPRIEGDAKAGSKEGKGQVFQAWENNVLMNSDNRARQMQWLENEVLKRQQRGVEVYRTK